MNRRFFMAGLTASACGPALASGVPAAEEGLDARARRRGLVFGSAVQARHLRDVPAMRAAILADTGMIVPQNDMKWRPTERIEGQPDYSQADFVARFAADHGLALRGHTAFWHQNPPAWAQRPLEGEDGAALALRRVDGIVRHFRGRVVEWDVVNEALEPLQRRSTRLRNLPIYDAGGFDFIADCFHAAHEADPAARLCYNDYNMEAPDDDQEMRRRAVLRLLDELQRRKAPVHVLGIQSHLVGGKDFDGEIFRRFLADVAAMGLRITLTEFDVNDYAMTADIARRDAAIADQARRFLAVALDEPAVAGLLCWGLCDRYGWLNEIPKRADHLPSRGAPLDGEFRRKPLWHAIAECLDAAPVRA